MRYPALITGSGGDYQAAFPDLAGCTASGETIDQAILHAEAAMQGWMDEAQAENRHIPAPSRPEDVIVPPGSTLTSILLVRVERKSQSARFNILIDPGVMQAMDSEADRRGMTRKRYLEWMMRYVARTGA